MARRRKHLGDVLVRSLFASIAIALVCGRAETGLAAPRAPAPLEIVTLSNRADLVSDGDALTEIRVPAGQSTAGLKVILNGRDVSHAFARRADGRIKGLLTGLTDGRNVVQARLPGGRGARLQITNHSRFDTILSGPFPAQTYYCATPRPLPAHGLAPATNASGLSGEPGPKCQIATEYKLYYKSTTPGCTLDVPDRSPPVAEGGPAATSCFRPYDPTKPRPADLAMTTTDAARIVPYIVRVERGVINRGIYDIAVLFDPTKPWTAVDPQPQWNRKIYYQFGGGTGNPHRQSRPTSAWTDDLALSRGFLVAQNSMTDSSSDSNRVLSAETTMMMKEHIGDAYGEILYTHGAGCSGGAIDVHTTMSLAPNLVDGFTLTCSLIDTETSELESTDCILLVEAYQKAAWLRLMETGKAGGPFSENEINAMKAAINGHRDQSACQDWFSLINRGAGNTRPGNYRPRIIEPADVGSGRITELATRLNNCQLPPAAVYDPEANPAGPRCGLADWAAGQFGRTPDGRRALETYDNVGVQYGLRALMDGKISGEMFVTLNEIIGGMDKDSNVVASRSVADEDALTIAYRTGLVVNGASVAKHPEIDLRGYDDSTIDLLPGAHAFGVHQIWRSFSLRDRLDRDAHGHGSQVMWRYGREGLNPPPQLLADSLSVMDAWLSALKKDASGEPIEAKVLKAKPPGAVDFCLLSSDPTQSVKVMDQAACDNDPYLEAGASPRQVAGGPRTEDVLKCQLRPLSLDDYGGRLTSAQFERLKTVFPTGVCDWRRPGVGQQAPVDAPVTFQAGPGGTPLGPPPHSTPLYP